MKHRHIVFFIGNSKKLLKKLKGCGRAVKNVINISKLIFFDGKRL
jgi:hypothetical protein